MENIKEEMPYVLLPKTLEILTSTTLTPPRMSHHHNLLVSYQRPQTRSVHATLYERFALLSVLQNHSNALDARDTDSRTLHKRAELWSEVTKNFNEKSVVQRNRHQVQTLYKNMKAKAKKYQTRLLEEGEGVEKDEVSEVLLKMLGGEHHRRRLSMQHAAILANVGHQDDSHNLSGSSTSTPNTLASNARQLLRSFTATPFLVNEVSPEVIIPHHDLSRFLKQEMHLPPSFKLSSANVSDGDDCSVSNSNSSSNITSEGDDRQQVPVAATLNGDSAQWGEEQVPVPLNTKTILHSKQPKDADPLKILEIKSEEDSCRRLIRKRTAEAVTKESSLNSKQTSVEEIKSEPEQIEDSSHTLPPPCSPPRTIMASILHTALENGNQADSLRESDQQEKSPEGAPLTKRLKLTESSDSCSSLVLDISIPDQENDGEASKSLEANQGSEESCIPVVNLSDHEKDVHANTTAEGKESPEESCVPNVNIPAEEDVPASKSLRELENPDEPYFPETFIDQNVKACCPIIHKEMLQMMRSRHRLEMRILRRNSIELRTLAEQRNIEHGLRVKLLETKLLKHQSERNTEGLHNSSAPNINICA